MGKPPEDGSFFQSFLVLGVIFGCCAAQIGDYGCPAQNRILPCRCSTRDMEVQIWCSHSELPKVLEGLKAVGRYVSRPVDELILENNNLPSLPGQVFSSLRVLRLMLRNNRLERVSSGWLEGLHDSLLELFLVEPDLRSLPIDSLENLHGLEAITVQSRLMKRLPKFTGLPKLRYLQVNSPALLELTPSHFRDLPSLEQLHVFGSPKLVRLEAGFLRGLQRLLLVNVTDCGVHWIHPRALIGLPALKEISLEGNLIADAGMVGRAAMDLPALAVLKLDGNRVGRLREASFTDLPALTRLHLSRNHITEISANAFQRLPMLKMVDLNYNLVHRIHPEFFPQRSGSGLEEMWLVNNDLSHVRELRSVLEALPRLKFLDASYNQIEEIPFGSLRGHPMLERLHLDHNRIALLQRESFTAMPALRELRLRNNSLSNMLEAPFWNLPALKGLDLSENYFRHVDRRLLANLPSLRRIDLSGNAVALIEPESFLGTPALEHINVSGNALSVIHPLTFGHLSNLYELDAGWNRLLEVVPGLPNNIEHLYLPMNRIVSLPPLSSQDLALPILRSLDLSANGVERIPPGVLSDLPNLRKLNLGFNALRVVEDGTFDGLTRLEQLDLRYNRLMTLHGRSFKTLRALMDLNLRGNRLEVIRPDIFHDNDRLQRVDLSRNNLAQIPHATFTNTRDLRELYASHNTLTELPGSLHGLTALQVLDLSFNKLNILSPETLSSLTSLLELKLVRNRIRELREGAFDRLPRLSLIDLENNDLRIIERNAVRALPELQALRLGKNRLQVIPTGAFSELPLLQSAELQENRIYEIAANAFVNVPHLLFLNLSYNVLPSLEYVGMESLRSLEVLDLSNNRISRVSSDHLAAMEWLVELKMDNNRICVIQGSPFDDMPRLRVLSLRNNRMASVSENAFKRLRSNIAILDIDGNPLSCSCGMLWLRGWLQQSSTEGPRCADGSLFKEVRLSRQDCQRERFVEPVHPGCEAEMINSVNPPSSTMYTSPEQTPPWMNLKNPNRLQPNPQPTSSQDSDYMYEDYMDYQYENSSSALRNSSTLNVVLPEKTTSPKPSTETPKPLEASSSAKPNTFQKVTTPKVPVKKNGTMPPSPSTSGFTFFGVPLPNLSFNLWGNSGRKIDRKEDNNNSTNDNNNNSRPGRGRFRAFPPTEPEIHRGGFVPLPRGQSGFVPIPDPRFNRAGEVQNISISSTSSILARGSSETTRWKSANATIEKIPVEKVIGKVVKEREELSTVKNEYQAATVTAAVAGAWNESRKQIRKEPQQVTAQGSSFSTQIYEGESLEVEVATSKRNSSKSSTTTPRAILETAKPDWRNSMNVKTANSSFQRKNNFSSTTSSSSTTTKVPETTTLPVPQFLSVTSRKVESKTASGLEASALSALLVPGGQVSSIPTNNLRVPIGRSTITKVPSPYVGSEGGSQRLVADHQEDDKEEGVKNGEESNVIGDDSNFSWYFQHYNDTHLESYLATVYAHADKTRGSCELLLVTVGSLVFLWT